MVARGGRLIRPGPWAYGLAALVIAVDQLSKQLIAVGLLGLEEGRSVQAAPFLDLTFHFNTGISFGLFQGGQVGRWLFTAFALAFASALAIWVWRARRPTPVAYAGLLMGGALGNTIDRLRWGAVADFIDPSPIHFVWIFNVADAAVTVGAALLLFDLVRTEAARAVMAKENIRVR